MPRVSKRQVDPEIEKLSKKMLYISIGEMGREEAENVIRALLTPEERLMLAKRIAAIMLLKAGYTYKKLDKILKIVPVTTNHIKNRVKNNQKTFRDFTKQLEKHTETRSFYQRAKHLNNS